MLYYLGSFLCSQLPLQVRFYLMKGLHGHRHFWEVMFPIWLSAVVCTFNYAEIDMGVVFSLIGVVLIAQPTFIFGSAAGVPSPSVGDIEKGTPAERLVAVG